MFFIFQMKTPKEESMDFEDSGDRRCGEIPSHVMVFLVASTAHAVSHIQTFDLEKWFQQPAAALRNEF